MPKPKLLDLFCGAGGVAKGYADAGFEVIGVDINPMPRFPYEFIQADAVSCLLRLCEAEEINGHMLDDFDVIHASPPCQRWSSVSRCVPGTQESYPDLITPIRELFKRCIHQFTVIENVAGAPINNPLILCGTSFGLKIRRHRLFETNIPIPALDCKHEGYVMNPYAVSGRARMRSVFGITGPLLPAFGREMGVDWMNDRETSEAIPPVYTEYIGDFLMNMIKYGYGYVLAA